MGAIKLDGASGWILSCGGNDDGIAIVATDTVGYVIVLHRGGEGLVDAYGHDWFHAVLDTVDLHPGE